MSPCYLKHEISPFESGETKRQIGACGIDQTDSTGFLDVTHMEEIQRVTSYKQPDNLAFAVDSLYWIDLTHSDQESEHITNITVGVKLQLWI